MELKSKWITYDNYLSRLGVVNPSNLSIYHQQDWLDTIRVSFNASVVALEVYTKDNQWGAVTPFMLINKGPFRFLGSPLSGMYTQFAGTLFADGLDARSRRDALVSQHKLTARRAHYVELGTSGDESDSDSVSVWRVLDSVGYDYTPKRTLLINLSKGETDVWNGFQTRARNMCRKAEKSGVTVRKIFPDRVWMNEYYAMLSVTFERQGRGVSHPLSFFQNLIKFATDGRLVCLAADLNGRNVASAIFLLDNHRMLYLSGTATDEGMKSAANSLIQWEAMRNAILSGVSDYDMGGLGVASIDKFKLSFGGREIAHHRWVYRSNLFRVIEPMALWAARKGFVRIGGA